MTGGPFVCTPDFYQSNQSYLWRYNVVAQAYQKIDSSPEPGTMTLGYDATNNYLYGIFGSDIYQIGSDGSATPIGTPTYYETTGGDFLPGTNFFLTEAGGALDLEDVMSTNPASSGTVNSAPLGTTAGSASFGGNDVAINVGDVSGQESYVGYGLVMGTTTATLYKLVIPVSTITANANSSLWTSSTFANTVTVTSLGGIAFPAQAPTGGEIFGAAYSDSAGDAFFYADHATYLYEATAAQLATGSAFTLAYEATGTGLSGGNDGAECPYASSPFSAPTPENDSYTVVTGNTLTVDGSHGASLLSNDQIVSGATVTMGLTTLEPGGPGQTSTTFSSGDTSGTLSGANGTLHVTDASNGYFTFAPAPSFLGAETFTYYLAETVPFGLTSTMSASVTINVVQQQVVTWSTPTTLSAAQASTTPNAATDLGGAPITYSVITSDTNTAGCSVDASSGEITYVGTGQCTIEAVAAATSSYSAASAQVTFTVALATPTLSWGPTPTTLTFGETGTTISGAPSTGSDTGTVSYAIAGTGNTAGCSLGSSSAPVVLHFTGTGGCSITASVAATSTYTAGSVTVGFNIGKGSQAISFTSTASSPAVDGTYVPTATGGASGKPVLFSIDGASTSGCSYGAGTVTFSSPVGTCVIDANQASNDDYDAAPQAQQTVTVGKGSQAISFTGTAPISPLVGSTYVPTATGGASGDPVTFSIDGASTSGCSYGAGTVIFSGPAGTCVIDANQAGNDDYDAAPQAQQTVTDHYSPPVPPVLEVSVSGEPSALVPASSYDLTVMPALGPAGGQEDNEESISIDLPVGETFSGAAVATDWSCQLSTGDDVLTCAWSGAVPVAAGTWMGDIEVAIYVASSASGALAATVTVSDSVDHASPLTVQTSADVSGTPGTPGAQGGHPGYRLVGSDGGVFVFGRARFFSSCQATGEPCHSLAAEIVGMAGVPGGNGYWLVGKDGGVFAFGDAHYFGSCPASTKPCGALPAPIVAIAATPDGLGYWLVAADGAVFAFGDAGHLGSCSSAGGPCGRLAAPIVGIAVQPGGRGYWLAGAGGAVYAFGQARSYGDIPTAGAHPLRGRVVGIATTSDGNGYWLAGSDGGVFAFGDAKFLGDTYTAKVEGHLEGPIVGIASDPDGNGYWLAGSDGGVFAFSASSFLGNTYTARVGDHLVGPVMGIAATT
jgi:hypothetical protein